MLNGIEKILTGDILKVLCDMGHGDELVIADANFPAESIAACTGRPLIRMPGIPSVQFLAALRDLFPVDWKYTRNPAVVMERTVEDSNIPEPEIWGEFLKEFRKNEASGHLGKLSREAFYERSKKSYVVIQTGEERQYGNLILVKGVVL